MNRSEGKSMSHTDRSDLGFAQFVARAFEFLGEYGFSEAEATPTIVRYRRGDFEVAVYHGRRSYEIGLEIGFGDQKYSMSEIIRASDAEAADRYWNVIATTNGAVAEGVAKLAALMQQYGDRALRGEPTCLAALHAQRQLWANTYALEVLAGQIRPKAHEAFRLGKYREAAELYERIRPILTAVELKKLAVAIEHK